MKYLGSTLVACIKTGRDYLHGSVTWEQGFTLSAQFLLQALREGERVIPRSRWDSSIEGYLATDKYNDQEVPYNEDAYEKFIAAGMNICLLATFDICLLATQMLSVYIWVASFPVLHHSYRRLQYE